VNADLAGYNLGFWGYGYPATDDKSNFNGKKKGNVTEQTKSWKDKFWKTVTSRTATVLVTVIVTALATKVVPDLWENFVSNRVQIVFIEGYVKEENRTDYAIVDAKLYVEGKENVELETDDRGYFSGHFEVRKKDKAVVLNCFHPNFDTFRKEIDIPKGPNKTIETDFHLERH